MTALESLDDVPLVLELRDVPEMAAPLDCVRESFDKLESVTKTNE
jgi:hypothetical protein